MKKISLVVSVYNEEEVLGEFYKEVLQVLNSCNWDYEIIFVNDGSKDMSRAILRKFTLDNEKVKVINFSRNFGHEAAMIAGIDYSQGDGIICMDADLQHPPYLIPEIIKKFEGNIEVVNMVRIKNKDAGLIKAITSKLFYKILNKISPIEFEENASDFFGLTKKVAMVLKVEYRERTRFLRGFVQSVGFLKETIEFEAPKRRAGESKYSIKKLFKFSKNALFSFSDLPLKLGLYSGIVSALIGVIIMIYSIYMKIMNNTPAGYSTLIVVICFMSAMQFIVIGIVAEYIGILFQEIKHRPIYIIEDSINISNTEELLEIK